MPTDNQALLLQVSATVNKLEKQMARAEGIVDKSSRNMERRAQAAATNLDRFFGKTDPAKALDKIFDNSRLRLFDSATARIGLTGSALELLGPAGLTAAAGIAAVGAAFAGARQAAKFADDISDTADRLHVTTDALQEFRYAIRAAGGEERGADEALEAFSETLGKASQGLPKALRGFKALFGKEFTAESVKGLGSVEEALVAVQARVQGLSNTQKDAIIAQFGLTGMKQLVEGTADQMERLRAEAHKVGIVMDAELVKRGGALNDEFETVAEVIKKQLMSALVDIGPVLVGLLRLMAGLAKAAADVADAFRSIENKTDRGLQRARDERIQQANSPLGKAIPGLRTQLLKEAGEFDAQLKANAATNKPKAFKPTKELFDTSKTPKGASGPRDDTDQRIEAINAALAGAARDLLQAQGGLTQNIEVRAEIERKIADEESNQAVARLEKQKADLAADKGFTGDKAAQQARLDLAIAAEQSAATAKQEAITRKAALDIEDRQIEVYQATVEAQIAALEVEANIATTAAAREKIEKRILELRQQLERDLAGTQIDRRVKAGEITADQGQALKDAQGGTQASARTQFDADHKNPVQRYLDSLKDVDTQMQEMAVGSAQDLANGLADAIVNAKSLGDVAKNVFRRMIADLLASAIQRDIAGPLLSLIPGFASGTNYAPGGLAMVGERGPELVNLPRGSQVTPTSQTLAALRNMQVPQRSGASVTIVQPFHFHAEGAVLTSELLASANAQARAFATSAAAGALKQANRSLPARQRAFSLLGTT